MRIGYPVSQKARVPSSSLIFRPRAVSPFLILALLDVARLLGL